MASKKEQAPQSGRADRTVGVHVLEQFSRENLTRWNALSKDLDELQASLYFGVQPEQRRVRPYLIDAIRRRPGKALSITRWSRIVTYQFSTEPLSAAGSLTSYGGRFNPGVDLDPGTLGPWPTLYIAEDLETALREKFQVAANPTVDGLTREELALTTANSYSAVRVEGDLHHVFDMTTATSLDAVAKVFARIKMPGPARAIQRRLRIPPSELSMIKTGRQLYNAVLAQNWRTLPVQFGLPAPSHTIAELIRAAGYEAILYRSTKGPSRCVALFPDRLASGSFVQLSDPAPSGNRHPRLDAESADELCGWETVPRRIRPI